MGLHIAASVVVIVPPVPEQVKPAYAFSVPPQDVEHEHPEQDRPSAIDW
jgi:hypothetical protein